MFEIVFLGGIAAVIYRKRVRAGDWSRGDFQRLLLGVGRAVSRALAAAVKSWPGLLQQCAADVRSLADDMTGVVRIRRPRAIRTRPSRLRAPAADPVAPAEAATRPDGEAERLAAGR